MDVKFICQPLGLQISGQPADTERATLLRHLLDNRRPNPARTTHSPRLRTPLGRPENAEENATQIWPTHCKGYARCWATLICQNSFSVPSHRFYKHKAV
ncbi:hypothetical protein SRHO_G00197420 [Serrasalmus rhombeus]